jgi:hypothetical protein
MSRLPFQLDIANPCSEQWQQMSGTNVGRHCQSCNKTVHNLAALTPSQIERLVYETNGELCARITRRQDGSLVMRERFLPTAATAALLTLVSMPVLAAAQSEQPATTIVSGKIESPTPALRAGRRSILIEQDGQARAMIRTDDNGVWHTELPPGTYDLVVNGITNSGHARVSNFTLHPGEQSFGTIKPEEEIVTVTVGEALVIRTSPLQAVA